jgi:hypothetical protein
MKQTPSPIFTYRTEADTLSDFFLTRDKVHNSGSRWRSHLWNFSFCCIRPTTAISMNCTNNESLGIRQEEYKKNIRSKISVFPEVNLTSVPSIGRAE